jgi:hypothetical protein
LRCGHIKSECKKLFIVGKKESTTRKTVTKSKTIDFLFNPATIPILAPVTDLSSTKITKACVEFRTGKSETYTSYFPFLFSTNGKSRMEYYPKVGFLKQESSFLINRAIKYLIV